MSLKFDFKTLGQPFEATWPVTAKVPQDGGALEDQTFDVRFRTLSAEEQVATDRDPAPQLAKLRLAIIDVPGETFSPELVEAMLSRGYIQMALIRAHATFVLGSPAKN